MKPVVAFTSGDPGGIGPEVAVAAMRSSVFRRRARPLAVGSESVFRRAGWNPSISPLIDPGVDAGEFRKKPTRQGGLASYAAAHLAVRMAARSLIGAVVTAPVSKTAWASAGCPHLDHTEMIQKTTGARRIAMILCGGGMRAVLATRHIPLRKVPQSLSAGALSEAAALSRQALDSLGIMSPEIALCGLNPHAGDGGLLGSEEQKILSPSARRLGLIGPLPADAAWAAHRQGRYDLLVCLYHDQALIPLKTAAGYSIVNWTVGAPLIRTSPGHGTAYDIAGRGRADPSGMLAAALLAAKLAA